MSSKLFSGLDARRWLAGVAVVGAGLLASCGGDQKVPFEPTRILAFGDELSLIEVDGRKYSINAFRITDNTTTPPTESTTELDCTRNPVWIQTVATQFALAFDRCLGTATAATGQVLARAGDKVADLVQQTLSVQGDALGEKDLALVMMGMNDVLELYAQYPGVSRQVLLQQVRIRGQALGSFVNQLATTGPAVVVLTVPDIGLSPFALAQVISTGDSSRSVLLTELVEALNNSMSVTLINDGRLIGLVYADVEIRTMATYPESYGLVNVILPACLDTAPLPDCTTATLVGATSVTPAATATTWLWADNLRLSPAGQSRLGQLAESRARGNPF